MKRDYAVGFATAGRYQHLMAHAPRRPQPSDAPEARAWFTSSQAIWAAVLRCDSAQVDHTGRAASSFFRNRARFQHPRAHESASLSLTRGFFSFSRLFLFIFIFAVGQGRR